MFTRKNQVSPWRERVCGDGNGIKLAINLTTEEGFFFFKALLVCIVFKKDITVFFPSRHIFTRPHRDWTVGKGDNTCTNTASAAREVVDSFSWIVLRGWLRSHLWIWRRVLLGNDRYLMSVALRKLTGSLITCPRMLSLDQIWCRHRWGEAEGLP